MQNKVLNIKDNNIFMIRQEWDKDQVKTLQEKVKVKRCVYVFSSDLRINQEASDRLSALS